MKFRKKPVTVEAIQITVELLKSQVVVIDEEISNETAHINSEDCTDTDASSFPVLIDIRVNRY